MLLVLAAVTLCQATDLGSRQASVNAAGSLQLIRSSAPDAHLATATGMGSDASCVVVHDKGSYLSVEIEVGTSTPPQTFEVVADTGSDSVIVPSCRCQTCGQEAKCFTGTNKSSTFLMQPERNGDIPAVVMTFGSGKIESVMATDVVKVGTQSVRMDNSLLLMLDQDLDVPITNFEGIMGLGLPQSAHRSAKRGANGSGDDVPRIWGFLEAGNIQTFSICVSPTSPTTTGAGGGDDGNIGVGALRFNTGQLADAIPSVGHHHWALKLAEMTVSGQVVNLLDTATSGSATQLSGAVIPDSGTTLMMGPRHGVKSLFAAICDTWDACKNAVQADEAKFITFQRVLQDCDDVKLQSLPSMTFKLGEGSTTKDITLTGEDYVMVTKKEKMEEVVKHLGDITMHAAQPTGQVENLCVPAFGLMDEMAADPGQENLWILGTPLFAKYTVTYSLQASAETIGFSTHCSQCGGAGGTDLLRDQGNIKTKTRRVLNGPVRVSHIHDQIIKGKAKAAGHV